MYSLLCEMRTVIQSPLALVSTITVKLRCTRYAKKGLFANLTLVQGYTLEYINLGNESYI